VVISLLASTSRHPVGGLKVIYELADALSRRGHEVHLVHVNVKERDVRSVAEITWYDFDPRVHHHFPPDPGADHLPHAEFLFGFGGEYPDDRGLPLYLVQGYRAVSKPIEDVLLSGPYPKLCVARWLVETCRELGVSDAQAVHLPIGLDHAKYRVTSPIECRPAQVAMAYNSHPLKRAQLGLSALAQVKRRLPEVEAVVFGATQPIHEIPAGVTYLTSPPQATIVERIYNRSRVFLNSSVHEGFSLPSIEAMACGCALVTTDNGGSRDCAFQGETALVAPPGPATGLATCVERLLRDDVQRVRLAQAGSRFVRRYDWDDSARQVEAFLEEYGAEPSRYQATAPAWREFHEAAERRQGTT
jgi:glycosyltransferase involved in cell wall biosynthesis